jgi:hypothetical protein
MVFIPKRRVWLSQNQLEKVRSVAQIIVRVCNISYKEAFKIAKEACVFSVPKRYAGGKTAMRGFE